MSSIVCNPQPPLMDKKTETVFSWAYKPAQVEKGYAGGYLSVDLSKKEIGCVPISEEDKRLYVGGRGFGLKALWEKLTPETKWSDPEVPLVVSGGPICGITEYPGTGKSLVVTLSPLTGIPIDSNVGGHFGPLLKMAGWDALEITGKSEEPVILYIDGDAGTVSIVKDFIDAQDSHLICEHLTDYYGKIHEEKHHVAVICTGRAGKTSPWAMLNFSMYDIPRRGVRMKQAGRGGIGMVLADKGIKAVVVKSSKPIENFNNPADRPVLRELGMKVHKECLKLDRGYLNMRRVGTPQLVKYCNVVHLLPVHNYKYGSHPEAWKVADPIWEKLFSQDKPDGCWYGCTLQCAKSVSAFTLRTGPYKGQKVLVDGPEYETLAAVGPNCGIFNTDHILEMNFYVDTYGLDSISVGTGMAFIMECYEAGILDEVKTEGLQLRFGNQEAALELLHRIANGDGFGAIAGKGIRFMKKYFVEQYGADPDFLQQIGMESKGLEYSEYVTKDSPGQWSGYAMANKGAQHDETWMMGMDLSNFIPTNDRRAEEIRWFSLFRTWMGLVGLCKMPWADIAPADNSTKKNPFRIQEHVDNYVKVFSAVTGVEIDEAGILKQSERMHTLQRLLNIRMGKWGIKEDTPPYRAMGPVTQEEYLDREAHHDAQIEKATGMDVKKMKLPRKIEELRRIKMELFEDLQQKVYAIRGWDENGIPTEETLKRLDIDFPEAKALVSEARKSVGV